MSRWFRLYDDAINDPKVLKLSDKLHRVWIGLLCVASKNDGLIPSVDDAALMLRMKPAKLHEAIASLCDAGLIDQEANGIAPHNWGRRQFKSDVSTDRVKRFRKRVETVSVTPPETENRNRADSVADATGANAPVDHRKRLFDEGLPKLAQMTGKGPDACRAFVGKCLKAAGDDAITVLGLIEDAERNQAVDPTSWIVARLKNNQPPQGNSNGRRTVHDAANDLLAKIHALDDPAPGGIRDGAGEGAVRLIPSR